MKPRHRGDVGLQRKLHLLTQNMNESSMLVIRNIGNSHGVISDAVVKQSDTVSVVLASGVIMAGVASYVIAQTQSIFE